MTRESALLVPLAAIIGLVALGVGFSTGLFHPEPLSSDGTVKRDAAAIVATATRKDAPSLLTYAQENMAQGDYAKAIVFLRAATQLNPEDHAAQKLLATAAFQNNDLVLAANACAAAARLNPTDADARLGIAKALFLLNLLPDAADACRQVIAMPSSSFEQRQAAQRILERIPRTDQKRPPETTFPIISAG